MFKNTFFRRIPAVAASDVKISFLITIIKEIKEASTNIQDAPISSNGKIICRIKKTHPAEDPKCSELCWK